MKELDALQQFLETAKSPLSFLDGTPPESKFPDNDAIREVFDAIEGERVQDQAGHWPTQSANTLILTIARMKERQQNAASAASP